MAVDKEIFELPEATAALLLGSNKVSFVAQVEGYAYDFQVSSTVIAEYLGVGKPTIYGGNTNPDNAVGVSGDIYVQSNGKFYQKNGNTWSLKANLFIDPLAYLLPLGTNKPSSYNLSPTELIEVNKFSNKYPSFSAYINGVLFPDITAAYTGSPGSFTQVTIALHDNGSGMNADNTVVQFS